ncbi:MAG: S41 family peptidase [Lachnospiraceae bacterium]|nr:S41 family peptidase [Lachnospiraceae bacterium]
MFKGKRIISILLASSMLMSALAGCTSSVPRRDAELLGEISNGDFPGIGKEVQELGDSLYEDYLEDDGDSALSNTNSLVTVESMEMKKIPFYVEGSTDVDEEELYFFNGNEAVAYMELNDFFELLQEIHSEYPDYNVEHDYVEGVFSAKRENGSEVYVDMADGNVYLYDYEMFTTSPYINNPAGVVMGPYYFFDDDGEIITDDDGEPLVSLFQQTEMGEDFKRSGYSMLLTLADYDIPVYCKNNKCYLPVATLSDVFLAAEFGNLLLYNAGRLFLVSVGDDDDAVEDKEREEIENGMTFEEIFNDVEASDRSEELAEFTYNELCLYLNANYGLKKEHNIESSFDEYFEAIGLKEKLMDPSIDVFSQALMELFLGYFGDSHSGISKVSPYSDKDYEDYMEETENIAYNIRDMIYNMNIYSTAREGTDSVDKDNNPIPYKEVGNTAFITFDGFTECFEDSEYYSDEYAKSIEDYIGNDTLSLIRYSNEQITREKSPIKNVVIDLSNNGGGVADAAAFVVSWVLGSCPINIENDKLNSQYTFNVRADVNMNMEIDEGDSLDLSKYRVFCLTNMTSFSCGNLVPALFKQSGLVTLLGRASGGGACLVLPGITADGTRISISSSKKLCTVKNGSYYPIDKGVEPDFTIGDPAHYYDRKWLSDYINQLP